MPVIFRLFASYEQQLCTLPATTNWLSSSNAKLFFQFSTPIAMEQNFHRAINWCPAYFTAQNCRTPQTTMHVATVSQDNDDDERGLISVGRLVGCLVVCNMFRRVQLRDSQQRCGREVSVPSVNTRSLASTYMEMENYTVLVSWIRFVG